MAVDDVVSDYETSVTDGARLSIQPASGDEWLVTHLVSQHAPYNLLSHTSTGVKHIGAQGGNTSTSTELGLFGAVKEVRFLITNSEYIRLHNASGATSVMGYSAIKTKE